MSSEVNPLSPGTTSQELREALREIAQEERAFTRAYLAALEDCLLPAKTVRPSLAADRRSEAPASVSAPAPAPTFAATAAKKKKGAKRPAVPIAPVASAPVPGVSVAGPSGLELMEIGVPSQEDSMLSSATAANEWTASKRVRKKKSATKTAAVVITISQEAAAAGETYESVFLKARKTISIIIGCQGDEAG